MPDSTLSRRSAALLRVDLGNSCFTRHINFPRKLQKNPLIGWGKIDEAVSFFYRSPDFRDCNFDCHRIAGGNCLYVLAGGHSILRLRAIRELVLATGSHPDRSHVLIVG